MKKIMKYIIFAVIILLIGGCVYMESKFSMTQWIKKDLSQEQILKECPEIAITENDHILAKEILGLQEVQMMIEQSRENNKMIYISDEEAEALLTDLIEDGWTMLELACMDNRVSLSWIKDGDKNVYYTFFADGQYSTQKTIGLYERHFNGTSSVETIYGNFNGVIEKNISERQWFYWLTELIENGYNGNVFFHR